MGGACVCLRTGSSSFTKTGRKEPEMTFIGHHRAPSLTKHGKSAASAKYQVPIVPDRNADTKIHVPGEDPELNLALRTPSLNEEEVKAFFVSAKQEEEGPVREDKNEVDKTRKTTAKGDTHIEVFSLEKSPQNCKEIRNDERLFSKIPGKTHTEVFHVGATRNQSGEIRDNHADPGQSVRGQQIDRMPLIDRTDPVHERKPLSGTDNPAFNSTEGDKLGGVMEDSTKLNNLSLVGTTKVRFTPDDPGANFMTEENQSDPEEVEEELFFFGMEETKIDRQSTSTAPDGVQSDREIVEIISDIETIEETMCRRLKRHAGITIGNDPNYTASERVIDGKHSNLFEDVLNNLKDVCLKVEDVLRKKGLDINEEISDDWLNLPDFALINQQYEKKTKNAQTATVSKLMEAAKDDDEVKLKVILAEFKYSQEKRMRLRNAETQKLMERLKIKMSSRQKTASKDEQDEEKVLYSHYKELIKNNDVSEEESASDGSSNWNNTDSQDECTISDSEELLVVLDDESTNILKETLTSDIGSRINNMTSSDFRSIMDMYRQERSNIINIRNTERSGLRQSLWEKLAERRKHVDQSVHEGLPNIDESESSVTCPDRVSVEVTTTSNGSQEHDSINPERQEKAARQQSVQTTAHSKYTSSKDENTETEEVLNEMLHPDHITTITEQELTRLTQNLLTITRNKTAINKQEIDELLKKHFDDINKIREAKRRNTELHRGRLLEKLKSRRKEGDVDAGDLVRLVKEEDSQFEEKEKLLQEECLQRFGRRQIVNEEDVERVMVEFKRSQEALNQRRIRQMSLLKQRLRDRLASRRKPDTDDSVEKSPSPESHRKNVEERIKIMDEEFYKSLKHKKDITQDELARLIEDHLNNEEEFKKNIKKQLSQRRKERREELSRQELSALVKANKENKEHLQRLRKEERNKVEKKLIEKLKQKKQKKQPTTLTQSSSGQTEKRHTGSLDP